MNIQRIVSIGFFAIGVVLTVNLLSGYYAGVKPSDPNPHVVFDCTFDESSHTVVIVVAGGHDLPADRTERLRVDIDDTESGETLSRTWISDGSGYNNDGKGYPVQEGDRLAWTDPRIDSRDVVRVTYEGTNSEDEFVTIVLDETTIPSDTA